MRLKSVFYFSKNIDNIFCKLMLEFLSLHFPKDTHTILE